MSRPLDLLSQAFICSLEGFRALPYDDKDGTPIVLVRSDSVEPDWVAQGRATQDGRVWRRPNGEVCRRFPTIGYGQRVWDARYYGPCTKDQARAWFQKGLEATYLPVVDRNCPNATDHQRGALASHSYNCGPGGFLKSGIPAAFAAGASQDALKKLWTEGYGRTSAGVVDPGLILRRAREWAYFCTPDLDQNTWNGASKEVEINPATAAAVLASVWATADSLTAELVAGLTRAE